MLQALHSLLCICNERQALLLVHLEGNGQLLNLLWLQLGLCGNILPEACRQDVQSSKSSNASAEICVQRLQFPFLVPTFLLQPARLQLLWCCCCLTKIRKAAQKQSTAAICWCSCCEVWRVLLLRTWWRGCRLQRVQVQAAELHYLPLGTHMLHVTQQQAAQTYSGSIDRTLASSHGGCRAARVLCTSAVLH